MRALFFIWVKWLILQRKMQIFLRTEVQQSYMSTLPNLCFSRLLRFSSTVILLESQKDYLRLSFPVLSQFSQPWTTTTPLLLVLVFSSKSWNESMRWHWFLFHTEQQWNFFISFNFGSFKCFNTHFTVFKTNRKTAILRTETFQNKLKWMKNISISFFLSHSISKLIFTNKIY